MMPNDGAQTIVTYKYFLHVDNFRQVDILHFHEYAVWLIVLHDSLKKRAFYRTNLREFFLTEFKNI